MKIIEVDSNKHYRTIAVADEDIESCVCSELGENFSAKVINKEEQEYIVFSEKIGEINVLASSLIESNNAVRFILGKALICRLTKDITINNTYNPVGFEEEKEIEMIYKFMGIESRD